MAVTVRIPTPLRKFTAGQETVQAEGGTIGEVLESLSASYLELGSKIFGEDDKIRRFVNVFVNDEDIRFLEQLDTAVAERDQVLIIPAIAGGMA